MLFDASGRSVSPVWYDRGSGVVLVRYADGSETTVPVSSLTHPKGPQYAARAIRAVRVP